VNIKNKQQRTLY